ncbi:MAG: TPM domain-containing protein [Bacteroidia bacterium]
MKSKEFFTSENRDAITSAIKEAEKITSGEIRVFIDKKCPGDVLDQAAHVFHKLKMHQTKERNGVLIYVSISDHKFAIIGDAGIHQHVKDDFWNKIKDEMAEQFRKGNITGGLSHAIHAAGIALQKYFPRMKNDKDELSNEIVFGND